MIAASNPGSKFFKDLPSRKKVATYHLLVEEPIDLNHIERSIHSGCYTSPDSFDQDLLRLFQNNLRFYGHHSPEGKSALAMRETYFNIKSDYFESLEQVLGIPSGCQTFDNNAMSRFRKKQEIVPGPPEDIINCPCGQFKEEGMMIQCEKCQIWQHLDCVDSPEDPDSAYFCCNCTGDKPKLDIKLLPQPDHYPGDSDYISLMRDDMQVRLGDTVYVLRALKDPENQFKMSNEGKEKVLPDNF